MAFACKNETLDSLYNHARLILTKSSKSKIQVVYEQRFKDHLSSTRQVGVEKRELELESEGMKCLGSILTGGNIFSQDFLFSHSEVPNTNIGIITNFA